MIHPGEYQVANKGLSNRQRKQNARRPAVSRRGSSAGATVQQLPRKRQQDPNRDWLKILYDKGSITRPEYTAGIAYRNAFSASMAEGVPLKSCLASDGVPGGSQGLAGQPQIITATEAKQTLFWLRWVVLGGQTNVVAVMDEVCGKIRSTADMCGGNDREAGKLNLLLKVALGQCSAALGRRASERAGKMERAS